MRWTLVDYFSGGNVPDRITQAGLSASNAKLVPAVAVAVALAGQGRTRGTVALAETDLCTNQSVALISPDRKRLLPEFLFQSLVPRYEELRASSSGGGRGGLTKGSLESFPVAFPSYGEQLRVSGLLTAVDSQIASSERQLQKENELYRAVDLRVFEQPAQTTRHVALASLAKGGGGKRLPAGHEYSELAASTRYLRVTDFFRQEVDFTALQSLHSATFDALRRYEILPRDLFISIAGFIG